MLSELSLKRLKDLTEKMAISGDEVEVRRYLEESYKTYGGELIADNLGSIALVKKSKHPNAKTVLLLGHMDEVGFMVVAADEEGLFSFTKVGGIDDRQLLSKSVVVGDEKIPAMIGGKPIHLAENGQGTRP